MVLYLWNRLHISFKFTTDWFQSKLGSELFLRISTVHFYVFAEILQQLLTDRVQVVHGPAGHIWPSVHVPLQPAHSHPSPETDKHPS